MQRARFSRSATHPPARNASSRSGVSWALNASSTATVLLRLAPLSFSSVLPRSDCASSPCSSRPSSQAGHPALYPSETGASAKADEEQFAKCKRPCCCEMLCTPVTSAVADSSCAKSPTKLAQIAPYMNISPASPCLPGHRISFPSNATSTAFARHSNCKAESLSVKR